MRAFRFLVLAAALMASCAGLAYDCQTIDTKIGDRDILMFCGFTFTRPFEFDFAPTNAPSVGAAYTAEFRIVYRDAELLRVMDDNLCEILFEGQLLNGWLGEFLENRYEGLDYAELLKMYVDGSIAAEVNYKFPLYLASRLPELGASADEAIKAVTVNVAAKGDLREALLALKRR